MSRSSASATIATLGIDLGKNTVNRLPSLTLDQHPILTPWA
jgi:hypothetical protein